MADIWGESPAKTRILLRSEADAMLQPLRSHGYDVVTADLSHPSAAHVRALLQSVELVLVDVTLAGRAILSMLQDLNAAIIGCDVAPRLICFSTAHRNEQFVLGIQRCGAHYARVSDSAMLREAIDLVLADIKDLRKNRLSFQILRTFAAGGGGREGEPIEAVLFPRAMADPQLRLALSERLVFDLLARHPRLSFDARQIAAALNAQSVKIRVPAIKVIVGRIRHAMSLKFAEAHLEIDPFDVLRSFLAAGTNRVLYKLCADCSFSFIPARRANSLAHLPWEQVFVGSLLSPKT